MIIERSSHSQGGDINYCYEVDAKLGFLTAVPTTYEYIHNNKHFFKYLKSVVFTIRSCQINAIRIYDSAFGSMGCKDIQFT